MKSSHRRISRALLACLGVVLAFGLIAWAYNIGKKNGALSVAQHAGDSAPAAPAAPAIDPGAAKETTRLATLVTPGPTTPAVPTTQPANPANPPLLSASANVPTTRPLEHVAIHPPGPSSAPSASATSAALASASIAPASLADARAKLDAGQLLTARRMLNSLLQSATLSDADAKAAKQLLNTVNATVVFSSKRFPDDELGGTFSVPSGGVLAKIAYSHEVTPELLMRINGITDPRRLQAGKDIKVLKGPFHGVIYKKDFILELWLGNPGARESMYITSFPVGLGKDDSTPAGTWAVANKLKNPAYYSPHGEGVIAADDPKNPLGEYWIGLAGADGRTIGKTSYGIHGTIDPSSIGKQESMGCIRLKNEDVAQVYEMLVEGKSTVIVKE